MLLNLKLLLPFRVFLQKAGVTRIVAETHEGSFGILPHRLDCVAGLIPGILTFTSEADGTEYVALDGGVLAKAGCEVLVSAHRAVTNSDLRALREAVKRDFSTSVAGEIALRSAVSKMESALLGRLRELHGDR